MLAILFGLIAMAGCVVLLVLNPGGGWWQAFKDVVQGTIPPFLFFVGLISIFIGIGNIKDKVAEKNVTKDKKYKFKIVGKKGKKAKWIVPELSNKTYRIIITKKPQNFTNH